MKNKWIKTLYSQLKLSFQWALALVGLILEGVSCFFIPFSANFFALMIPICIICFGIALIDTALLPMLGFIVDKKYTAVYGSVYAIADISYCAGGLGLLQVWENIVKLKKREKNLLKISLQFIKEILFIYFC